MPSHGPKGDPHNHKSHNSHGRPHREGILGLLDRISQARESAGSRVRGGVEATGRQLASGAGLLDRAMRFVGENPLDFTPGTAEGISLGEGIQAFQEGRPGAGLLGLAGAAPIGGRAVKPVARAVRGLFSGMEGLRGAGLRVFARSEGPGLRTVASITPNPKAGGGVKVSIFEESAEFGASELPVNVIEFGSVDEAMEAIEGGRGFFRGFEKVPVGPEHLMEGRFERIAERGLFPRSATDPAVAKARSEARQSPGSVGGFFSPR